MKVRLIRIVGAISLGLLITSMAISCSRHQTTNKKYSSNDGVTHMPPPPPAREMAPPPPPSPYKPSSSVTTTSVPTTKRPATPQNSVDDFDANESLGEVVTEIPEPAVMEEEVEVVEDASGRYDNQDKDNRTRDRYADEYGDTDSPRTSEAQRKEVEKSKLDDELKALKTQVAEMDESASRNEADRKRAQQDLARTQERAALKNEEIRQAREREALAKKQLAEAARARKADELTRREADRQRLKKEMAELKRKEEEARRLANKTVEPVSREDYAHIDENDFTSPLSEPLSTFSIDVDKAAYANTRRYLNSGSLPPAGAVRIEELVNYFHYDYRQPFSSQPFAFNTETSSCPWNSDHQLVHIGLKGRVIDRSEMPASNLVFLLDVSGSMNNANKLPLLKKAFSMLIDNLNGQDRVAIVVYAGAAGVVLPSTPASQKGKIMQALNQLRAGGSTAGGAGIQLAYQIARNHLIKGGNNRVILATDGDFNVGPSSESALIKMIESKRQEGVFLSVLGFGTGNYQDRRMEQLADHGNGNYAYIDNLQEAQKVLVQEMGGTLHAIAKDVKIQIEFNPTYVKAYRLIGYENRALAAQDFNDDTKDAGELGAGHTVTALYEIVPHSANTPVAGIDPLKYQQITPSNLSTGAELMTLKFRYKEPDGDVSKLLTEAVKVSDKTLSATSDNYRFSAAVAAFGMLLRGSRYSGDADYDMVIDMASKARGRDANNYRAEFIRLVHRAKQIDTRRAITEN